VSKRTLRPRADASVNARANSHAIAIAIAHATYTQTQVAKSFISKKKNLLMCASSCPFFSAENVLVNDAGVEDRRLLGSIKSYRSSATTSRLVSKSLHSGPLLSRLDRVQISPFRSLISRPESKTHQSGPLISRLVGSKSHSGHENFTQYIGELFRA
jgi:hypothetical protein